MINDKFPQSNEELRPIYKTGQFIDDSDQRGIINKIQEISEGRALFIDQLSSYLRMVLGERKDSHMTAFLWMMTANTKCTNNDHKRAVWGLLPVVLDTFILEADEGFSNEVVKDFSTLALNYWHMEIE